MLILNVKWLIPYKTGFRC